MSRPRTPDDELSDNVEYDLLRPGAFHSGAHQRVRRARTMTDIGQSASLLGEVEEYFSYPRDLMAPLLLIAPRRSAPQMRLHVSIPIIQIQEPEAPRTSGTDDTPQSESPETPASLSSPIAGVVDLTRQIRTLSSSPVAQGGLSDIYKGERSVSSDIGGGEEIALVAIKVLRIFTIKDQDGERARKRLNREVYVWHRLQHPNVVKLFGTSYHMGGRPAMVMQWYDNGSAAEYLAKKNPSADRVQLILDVARGLAYLHTHNPPIIHGDLKGNNVLITDDGHAALCDFGLSQVMEELVQPTGNTLSCPDVGPLRWQAPEFTEEDTPLILASDVWSFGCTAFELLTSRIPYAHRARDGQVIRDMQNGVKPSGPSHFLLESFDSRIGSLLDLCWSFCADERPSMTRVVSELEEIYNS